LSQSPDPHPAARERWWIALLLLGCACLALYRLGAGSLWDQDETKYARIAVEMLHTGDPITLYVNGQPWFVHPPLYMWLVAATGALFGFTEFSVRIWSALFSIVGVYATVLLGRALFGIRVGLLGGAILAVTLQYLMQSRLAVFDTVLLAWMLLALYAFYRAYRDGQRADYLRFFLFAGLGTLTKGPIGLVLPGLVIVAFVTIRRAWARWREVPWGAGLAVYAVVGLSWYAAETLLQGPAFIASVFGYYTFGRFFGVVESQANPWYLYIPVIIGGAFPWTTFWPAAARLHLRRCEGDGSLLVLLWCGITFAFYTAAGTKLPNYILPIYPLAAIAVAALWEPTLGTRSVGRSLGIPLVFLLGLVGVLFWGVAAYLGGLYPAQYHTLKYVLVFPAAALVAGVGIVLVLAVRGRSLAAFAALCLTMAVTWIGVLTWVMPVVEAQKPMKPLALAIKGALAPGDRIIGYRMNILASLIFYTDHTVEWVDTPEVLRARLCAPGRVFLVIEQKDLESLRGIAPSGLRPFMSRSGTTVLLKPAGVGCALGRVRSISQLFDSWLNPAQLF
jgi:4-amino-4-deoxy-L-arabinose transferase-like glycosyltransferase